MMIEDTYSVVKEHTPHGKTYCALCSRLRRGILYTCAHELGANKLALGHHADDAIETLFLNMLHQGQMKGGLIFIGLHLVLVLLSRLNKKNQKSPGMPARYYSEQRHIHVIRPLMCVGV